jgi:RNA polymerase sigma-32 factor
MNDGDGTELDPDLSLDPPDPDDAAPARNAEARAESTALVPAKQGGLVAADPLRRYLAEVGRYAQLGREEELELARRYRDTGDRTALFALVTANLRLVVRVAFSFRRAARNLLDLVQEGNLGLLAAIERFDPELGVRLPTYATWWIRAYMIKFLLDNVRMVRVGTTNARRKLLRNLRQEKQRLEAMGYEVGPRLLAEHFGVSEDDVTDVQRALDSRDVSLDEPLPGSPDRRQADVLPDVRAVSAEDTVARRELQAQVEAVVSEIRQDLSERDRVVLDERLLSDDPVTLQALGDRFGTSREAVRQAEERLKKRLAKALREKLGEPGEIHIGGRT